MAARGAWLLTVTGGPSRVRRDFHPLADEWHDIEARERRCGIAPGQPVLMSRALIDYRLGDYFRTAFRGDQMSTARTYATELRTWFTFLDTRSVSWDEADFRDVRAFQVWRVYAAENPRPVSPATWNKGWEALNHFYRWASRDGLVDGNPMRQEARLKDPGVVGGHREKNARSSRDRWLTPMEYAFWRDVGFRGYGSMSDATGRLVPGLPAPGARARNTARNAAFADYALTTGLRLTELGSLLTFELPEAVDVEVPIIGKGGTFRFYRVLHALGIQSVACYLQGERRAAVSRGRRMGRYDLTSQSLVVAEIMHGRRGQSLRLTDGRVRDVPSLATSDRERLMVLGSAGPEPAWLWLSDSGKPLVAKAWTDVFDAGNQRVTRSRSEQGIASPWVKVTPHSLRFSFALFVLLAGIRAIDQELGIGPADAFHVRNYSQAFEEVRDLLGHSTTATTRSHYLEPVKGLRRSTLLRGASLMEMWEDLAAKNPLIGFGGGR